MCLMLYLAANAEVPIVALPHLCIEHFEAGQNAVRRWFSLPVLRFVGAHTGCSCGFPSVAAEQPVEYYDGVFDDAGEDRAADLASVRALFETIGRSLAEGGAVELLAVWVGDEAEPPRGTINLRFAEMEAEKFFFTERFLYKITA